MGLLDWDCDNAYISDMPHFYLSFLKFLEIIVHNLA